MGAEDSERQAGTYFLTFELGIPVTGGFFGSSLIAWLSSPG
ncbi:MAG: hypothetical protein JWQ59_1546 [Cryobacterium sp.]|nr:hypothetical protein [Cryobacterium sp.]